MRRRSEHRRGRRALAAAVVFITVGSLHAMASIAQEVVRTAPQGLAAAPDLEVRDGQLQLSLEEAIIAAMRRNLGLQVQRYRREQAFTGIMGAKGIFDLFLSADANIFEETSPAVSAIEGADIRTTEGLSLNLQLDQLLSTGGVASFSWDNSKFETNSIFSTVNPSYNIGTDFLFNQPLLRGFGSTVTKRGIYIARNNSLISLEALEQRVITTVLDVEAAYWDVVEGQEQLKVSLESLELAKELHQMNRIQVDVGTMAPLELVQSEVGVATREEEVLRAETRADDAADRLRQLLNLEGSDVWTVPILPTTDPEMARVTVDVDEAIEVAMAERSELRAQNLVLANLEIDQRVFSNLVRPRLDLQLRYGFNGLGGDVNVGGTGGIFDPRPPQIVPGGYSDAFDQIVNADFDGWSAGLVFGYPVQNREARANRTIADLAVEEGRTELDDLKLSILTEVRRTARAVLAAAEAIDLAKKSTDLAEKNLDAEQKRYENGLSTSFTVLEIQEDLTQARSREVTSIAAYRRALALFYGSQGRLLDANGIEIEDSDAQPQEPSTVPPR
ncbi:MAG TPA: TolC family protein [Thermoanaerobaculia bacterium]|nr:TolC family protein [Thermoanaerobaculia bacterium]